MASISLRPIQADDADFLFALYASTREEELAQVPWTAEQKHDFLKQQFYAQHTWWQQEYAGSSFDIVRVDGADAGRLYVHRSPSTIRIVDIALLPQYRGQQIGQALLEHVFAEADASGRLVSIHVEVFNRARRLYERMGFVVVEDKGVYLMMERPAAART